MFSRSLRDDIYIIGKAVLAVASFDLKNVVDDSGTANVFATNALIFLFPVQNVVEVGHSGPFYAVLGRTIAT